MTLSTKGVKRPTAAAKAKTTKTSRSISGTMGAAINPKLHQGIQKLLERLRKKDRDLSNGVATFLDPVEDLLEGYAAKQHYLAIVQQKSMSLKLMSEKLRMNRYVSHARVPPGKTERTAL